MPGRLTAVGLSVEVGCPRGVGNLVTKAGMVRRLLAGVRSAGLSEWVVVVGVPGRVRGDEDNLSASCSSLGEPGELLRVLPGEGGWCWGLARRVGR